MSGARYKVASVTGYDMHGGGTHRANTDYSILDTAVCHRIVATVSARGRKSSVAGSMARRIAESLNAGNGIPWWNYKRRCWTHGRPPSWFMADYPSWPFL